MPSDNPPEDAPRDPRPRPEYGELAPEGWVWEPPADARVPVPVPPPAGAPVAGAAAPVARPGRPPAPGASPVPGWDRPVALGLLIFGLLATFFTVSLLNSLPQAVQMLYTQSDLGTYTPAESVGTLITAGAISEVFLWLATAAIAVRQMVRRRRAFYLPIIGGVLSAVVLFAFMAVVLATDATLLEYFGQP